MRIVVKRGFSFDTEIKILNIVAMVGVLDLYLKLCVSL